MYKNFTFAVFKAYYCYHVRALKMRKINPYQLNMVQKLFFYGMALIFDQFNKH